MEVSMQGGEDMKLLEILNDCCEVCGKYGESQCATCPVEIKRQTLVTETTRTQLAAATDQGVIA